MKFEKLEAAIAKANGGSLMIGKILCEIGEKSPQAAEMIEQDLTNAEMGLEQCYKVLYDYAAKHAEGGFFGFEGFEITPENPAIRMILDFYHIPHEWLAGETKPAESQTQGERDSARRSPGGLGGGSAEVVDLLDCL